MTGPVLTSCKVLDAHSVCQHRNSGRLCSILPTSLVYNNLETAEFKRPEELVKNQIGFTPFHILVFPSLLCFDIYIDSSQHLTSGLVQIQNIVKFEGLCRRYRGETRE